MKEAEALMKKRSGCSQCHLLVKNVEFSSKWETKPGHIKLLIKLKLLSYPSQTSQFLFWIWYKLQLMVQGEAVGMYLWFSVCRSSSCMFFLYIKIAQKHVSMEIYSLGYASSSWLIATPGYNLRKVWADHLDTCLCVILCLSALPVPNKGKGFPEVTTGSKRSLYLDSQWMDK